MSKKDERFPEAEVLAEEASGPSKAAWRPMRFEQFDELREGLEEIDAILGTRKSAEVKSARITACLEKMEMALFSLKRQVYGLEYKFAWRIFLKSIAGQQSHRELLRKVEKLCEDFGVEL